MIIASRRSALLTLAAAGAAAPILLAVQRAAGQTAPIQEGDQSEYVSQTLAVGSVALQTSQIAAEKATDPMVKEFANLEVGEQQAIASILASTEAGKTPPELPAEDAAKIEELNGMEAGPEFDAAYVQGQVDGHNRLLEIQQTLSGETVATVEAITARLAEQAVMSHLAMLNHIQAQMGQAQGQSGTEAQGQTEGAAEGEASGQSGSEEQTQEQTGGQTQSEGQTGG